EHARLGPAGDRERIGRVRADARFRRRGRVAGVVGAVGLGGVPFRWTARDLDRGRRRSDQRATAGRLRTEFHGGAGGRRARRLGHALADEVRRPVRRGSRARSCARRGARRVRRLRAGAGAGPDLDAARSRLAGVQRRAVVRARRACAVVVAARLGRGPGGLRRRGCAACPVRHRSFTRTARRL
ncbi:MAG: hypothetical protein AVDCRST_MAG71-391, partial [uncultured Lysobacter sp.]